MPVIYELWDKTGTKRKANKGGYQIVGMPSDEVSSSDGDNLEVYRVQTLNQYKKLDTVGHQRMFSIYLVIQRLKLQVK